MNFLRFPLLIFNLCLVALLGYFLTRLFLPQVPTLTIPSLAVKNNQNQQVTLDISPLLNRRWFHQNSAPPLPAQTQLPETALKLTLQGVLFSDDPQQAKAIIAGSDNKTEVYRCGQTIQDAVLQDIFIDRVIFERNGNQETLKLKKESSNTVSSQASQPVAQSQISLKDYRQQIIDKPANLNKIVRIKPSENNGKLVGYELNAGSDPQLFQQLGLQNGDIAIKINEIPLDIPSQSFNALQQLSTAKNFKIDLLRKGTPQTVSINLN
jgi:general secretion pathway protein C